MAASIPFSAFFRLNKRFRVRRLRCNKKNLPPSTFVSFFFPFSPIIPACDPCLLIIRHRGATSMFFLANRFSVLTFLLMTSRSRSFLFVSAGSAHACRVSSLKKKPLQLVFFSIEDDGRMIASKARISSYCGEFFFKKKMQIKNPTVSVRSR
jgi:hypothetical protein